MINLLRYFLFFIGSFYLGIFFILWWQEIFVKDEPTKPMTNFDKIIQSPEELANFIVETDYKCSHCVYKYCNSCQGYSCKEGLSKGITEYLKQKVEEK